MLFLVIFLFSNILNAMNEPIPSVIAGMSSGSSEELCDVALSTFMRKTDSDLAKYIRPHLVSVIKDATSSPESDDDEPSRRKVVRRWAASPDTVKHAPKSELDEIVLLAVQKAFEEKEIELLKKSEKIDRMFSKKSTAIITAVVSSLVTLTTSLTSVYTTKNNFGNCTK
jgi:hypothetical protein